MISAHKKDLLWILTVSSLILLLGSIPNWAGYQAQTEELRFRGIYYDSQDYAVHLGAMEAGRHGEWAYQFRFTTEPHRPAYIKLFYTVLGHLNQGLRLSPDFTFQLARWILSFVALFALYTLMKKTFPDLFWARTAFLLAALGSGLGWLQVIFHWTSTIITPIDFWLADDYVFFSLSVFPHFAFVTAGMCMTFNLWLDFLETKRWVNIGYIALIAILVQFVNPIAFATVDIGIFGAALFSWWRERQISKQDVGGLLVIAIAQIPLLAYNFLILSNDPLWGQFTTQNKTLSPPPDYYIWGFALFWPLALLGATRAFRTKSKMLGAAVLWVMIAFLLAYAPVYIQRRFLQNITIPLAMLAVAGLIKLFEMGMTRSPSLTRWRFLLVTLLVFFTSISSIQIGLSQPAYLQTHPENYYYSASLEDAVKWFRQNAQYNDFVLASEQTSQVLVQKAGLRAYTGHEMETLNYPTKQSDVQKFFQGQMPDLATSPIRWVVYGPFEKDLNPNFKAPASLTLVYDIQELQIYEVK